MERCIDAEGLVERLGSQEIDLTDWTYVMPGVAQTDIYARGDERVLVDRRTVRAIIQYTFQPRR